MHHSATRAKAVSVSPVLMYTCMDGLTSYLVSCLGQGATEEQLFLSSKNYLLMQMAREGKNRKTEATGAGISLVPRP